MMKTIGYYVLVLFSIVLMSSCGKGGCNVIPDVTINNVNINRGSHVQVYSTGGWVYAAGGVRGLIVYNTGNGLIAYDRCSTVDPQKRNQVKVDGLLVIDEASGAKWLLMDGSPTHLAECSLRRYSVRKSGDNYYVSN